MIIFIFNRTWKSLFGLFLCQCFFTRYLPGSIHKVWVPENLTKHSSVLLLLLVRFSMTQTLHPSHTQRARKLVAIFASKISEKWKIKSFSHFTLQRLVSTWVISSTVWKKRWFTSKKCQYLSVQIAQFYIPPIPKGRDNWLPGGHISMYNLWKMKKIE